MIKLLPLLTINNSANVQFEYILKIYNCANLIDFDYKTGKKY